METKYIILSESEIRTKNTCNLGEISPFDAGIPLIDISDKTIEEIYYYRWHCFLSHVKNTPHRYLTVYGTKTVTDTIKEKALNFMLTES